MRRHDSYRTGFSNINFDPTSLNYVWDAPELYANPIVVGDILIASKRHQKITAFSLSTGEELWENDIDVFGSQAVYADGTVWYTTQQGVHQVDVATGAQQDLTPITWYNLTSPQPLVHKNADGSVSLYTSGNDLVHIKRTTSVNGDTNTAQVWEVKPTFPPPVSLNYGKAINLAGDSLIINQPGQYAAVDAVTGAANLFHSSSLTGGGDPPAVYDEARETLYIAGQDSPGNFSLKAYDYSSTQDIVLKWELVDAYYDVAIDGDGYIYAKNGDVIEKIDPDTQQILGTATGDFRPKMMPTIIGDVMIAYSRQVGALGVVEETYFYDTGSMELIHTIAKTGGGFVANGFFVQTHPDGISVYQVSAPVDFGDVNLDGVVDFFDISPFIGVLSTGEFQAEADCDESGNVDFLDISPFIAILSGS